MKRQRHAPSGFSLLELMVLIALLGMLAAVFGPVVNSGREMVNRAQCASNLRQIGVAIHIDAQLNDKQFPVNFQGNWAWDMDVRIANRLLATGAVTKETFYCPSGTVEIMDDLWNFAVFGEDSGFRILTYVLLFDGTAGVHQMHTNRELGEQSVVYPGHTPETVVIPESERELAADAVLALGNTVDSDFIGIQGGLAELHRTNHVNGDRPAGGNILFMDGTVGWRDFSEMRIRSQSVPSWWW